MIPSITLTIYFGAEEWSGPLNLLEMMGEMAPETRACIDDYHLRLIAPAQMSDEEIMKFQSSMREVLLFIKYSKDKQALEEILNTDHRFKGLERRAVDVIEAITKSGLKYNEKEGTVKICEAIRQMRAD